MSRKIPQAIAITCALLVCASVVLQKALHLQPCKMCTLVRYIYCTLCIAAALASIWQNVATMLFVLASAFAGFATSIYHTMVQLGIAPSCVSKFNGIQNFQTFYNTIQNTTPCSSSFAVFGMELTFINAAVFGLFIVAFIYHIKQNPKPTY